MKPTPSPSLLNKEITGNEHKANLDEVPPLAGSNTTSKSLSKVSYVNEPAATVLR